MASLEKRRKFLPCVVYANQRKDSYKMFVFPNKDVVVNSTRSSQSFEKTGYTTSRSTAIDLTDPKTPIFKATVELTPRAPNDNVDLPPQPQMLLLEENNNIDHFISTIIIPR